MAFFSWLKNILAPQPVDAQQGFASETKPTSSPQESPEDVLISMIEFSVLDGNLENEKEFIAQYAQDSGISDAGIREAARKSALPIAQRMLDDGIITEEEEEQLKNLCSTYNLQWDHFDEDAKLLFSKGRIVRDLLEEKIHPRVNSFGNPFNFQKNEILIWLWPDVPMEVVKTKTRIEGRSRGISIRIMKGVYYRTGAFGGERVSRQEVESLEGAVVAITSKNLYYLVRCQSKKISHNKIVTIQPYSDAVIVTPDGSRAYPLLFYVDDPWFFTNVLQNAQNWDDPNWKPPKGRIAAKELSEENDTPFLPADPFEIDANLYAEAVRLCRKEGQVSISLIQRKFRVGFNNAARIVEQMERDGIIGPAAGPNPRKVL